MICLISQVTFIFLTQIYYNMNFITLPSNFITRFPWYFGINLRRLLLEHNFWHTKKCKTKYAKLVLRIRNFVKMQGNLWKISCSLPTLLKYWSSTIFFQRLLTTVFKEHQFPSKNQKVPLCWVLWIQN